MNFPQYPQWDPSMPNAGMDMLAMQNMMALQNPQMPPQMPTMPMSAPLGDPAMLQNWAMPQGAAMPQGDAMPPGAPELPAAAAAGMGLNPEQLKMLMNMMPKGQQGQQVSAPGVNAPTYKPVGAKLPTGPQMQPRQGLAQLIYGR